MASLTQSSIVARKIIRYGVYAVIFIIIARFTFKTAVSIYLKLFPPSPPEPTVGFGKLAKIPFPLKEVPTNISYKLEIPEGKLPEIPEQAKVYFMPPISAEINVEDQARARADKLGFKREGKMVVENIPNVWVFPKSGEPSNLTMNIITGIFSISYDLNANPQAISGIAPTPESAISKANSILSAADILANDIKNGTSTHEYLRIEAGNFIHAISQSEAQAIRVNLFRKSYADKIPNVTPEFPKESNVWFIFTKTKTIAAEYHYYPIDEKKVETYPLKTAEVAWEELKSNKGFITNLGDNKDSVTVRKVYLAYYDAGQYTEFYQPVIVFEGDNEFAGVVPAVTDEYYGAEAKEVK